MNGSVPDDRELVERAKQGDARAYEELVRRHQAPALRVAHAIAGADAADAVQEAFIKAYRSLARFRDGAPFRPWVLRIVANEARNLRRSSGRRAGLALRLVDDAADPSPEEAAIAASRRQQLACALALLPERDRIVIAYRWFADMTEREMASALGCRPGTVKSRLARAHGRLSVILESWSADQDTDLEQV